MERDQINSVLPKNNNNKETNRNKNHNKIKNLCFFIRFDVFENLLRET